jgi:pimeloyl-ACP methyl ester carboxylesterase
MPTLETADAEIYFEEYGEGFPLLLFAPGGMRSTIGAWRRNPADPDAAPPWMDPTIALAGRFRVIAMDQRNAGRSRAPVRESDDWSSFTRDHIALLDHLGIAKCHLMGGCIGASYVLALCKEARDRVAAVVLQNPIGIARNNRHRFRDMFGGWAKELVARDGVDPTVIGKFGSNMFDGEFVFSVSRDDVRACDAPMLVLPGSDVFHPRVIAEEIAALAPSATILADWKGPAFPASTIARVERFLCRHSPEADIEISDRPINPVS